MELLLAWAKQENWPWLCGHRKAGGPNDSATTQAQGFELAQPNMDPMCELLEWVRGPVL